MENETSTPSPLKADYFDAAIAYGGSLQVLSLLFAALDRSLVRPSLISYVPQQKLAEKFCNQDVGLILKPTLSYVVRERWLSHFKGNTALTKIAAYAFSALAILLALPNQIRLFRHLLSRRPDVLHINNNFMPVPAALLLGIPIIWHLHGVPFKPSPWEQLLLKKIDNFIAISDYVSAQATRVGYPSARIVTLLNPAPPSRPIPPDARETLLTTYHIPANHLLIAHIGRLVSWKGQLEFLNAFALVVQKYPHATALIVGDDAENFGTSYTSTLKRFVADHYLTSNVIFTGHTNQTLNLMAAVDIVIHSSIEPEPFGLVIIEAMSVGTCVIAANKGAPPEIIEQGRTGFLVPPESSDLFSAAILTLLTNDGLRRELASNGRQKVESELSPTLYAEKITRLYRTHCPG